MERGCALDRQMDAESLDLSEAKKRRAALLTDARQYSDTLAALGEGLRGLEFYTEYWSGRPDSFATILDTPHKISVV